MDLNQKIEIFKKEGVSKLQIISDFDVTLTKAFDENGESLPNSINVFRLPGYISEEYSALAEKLFQHYHPIEQNYSLDEETRLASNIEWWTKKFELFRKFEFNKRDLDKVIERDEVHLRDGFVALFKLADSHNIPFLIFSAGVGDVIRMYLDKLKLKTPDVHVISNIHKYDSEGKFIGVEGDIIHSMNKNMSSVSHFPYWDEVRERKNIILIGDSLGDLHMADGFEYDNMIKIGFFNKKEDASDYQIARQKYYDSFDLVIEHDEGLDEVIDLIKEIV